MVLFMTTDDVTMFLFLDVNECDDPELNKCQKNETCINSYGSFKCIGSVNTDVLSDLSDKLKNKLQGK